MGNCDVCHRELGVKEGYLLTTLQVVTTPGYWEAVFSDRKVLGTAALWGMSVEEAKARMARLSASDSTPWMVCNDCISIFTVDKAKAREYAIHWYESGGTFNPPGSGPAPLSTVDMGDGRKFYEVQESPIIQIDTDSLEIAWKQILPQIPQGLSILSEKVITEEEVIVTGSSETEKKALAEARNKLPPSTDIIKKGRPEIVPPSYLYDTVKALDEQSAREKAEKANSNYTIKAIKLVASSSKGFLGIGKHLNRYEVNLFKPAMAKITYRTKAKVSFEVGEPVLESNKLVLSGAIPPFTRDIYQFCSIAATNRTSVLLINTKEYSVIIQKILTFFSDRFGSMTSIRGKVISGELVCNNCGINFPSSYIFHLSGTASAFKSGVSIGSASGSQESGQTVRCPKCGSTESLYIYYNPGEVLLSDLDAIRQYSHHLAREWWKTESKEYGICDICGINRISRGEGYKFTSDILCEHCVDEWLSPDALDHLRGSPNYFGKGILREARFFVTNK